MQHPLASSPWRITEAFLGRQGDSAPFGALQFKMYKYQVWNEVDMKRLKTISDLTISSYHFSTIPRMTQLTNSINFQCVNNVEK